MNNYNSIIVEGSFYLRNAKAPASNQNWYFKNKDDGVLVLSIANDDYSWRKTILNFNGNTGNVGIGTTTLDAKLTVAGNIHSREVKVTIDAVADFVFEEAYALQKLENVATYVKENKHLSEIAPATIMEANGLELGQVNINLLQKIEEFTLYTIE